MGKATILRNLLNREPVVIAPGCYDCLSALKTMIGTYQYIIEAKHVSEEYLAHKTVDFERAWEILDLQLWNDIKNRFNPTA